MPNAIEQIIEWLPSITTTAIAVGAAIRWFLNRRNEKRRADLEADGTVVDHTREIGDAYALLLKNLRGELEQQRQRDRNRINELEQQRQRDRNRINELEQKMRTLADCQQRLEELQKEIRNGLDNKGES